MNPWRMAVRIALREARAAKGKFLFVILAVAAGVACVTGVRGFSEAFRGMLLREARTLMAADITVRTFEQPDAAQSAAMNALTGSGAVRTWITETFSMISSSHEATPLLVSIKAVEPKLYPFYGQLKLDPAGELRDRLTADTVLVSDDLLLRLGAAVGESLQIGEAGYRIAGVIVTEPDRMTGSLNVGPRVMLSREGLDRSRLVIPGSRAAQRFLFRLPRTGLDVTDARRILKKAFPDSMIADYRETHPVITRGLDHATKFLSLVSLVSLIVGALGVATAMHSHLRQRMDSIAVMKCIGGRSSQVIRIFVVQTLLLGLAGSLIGIVFGLAVQSAFPAMIARYFPVRPGIRFNLFASVQGLGAGLLTTLLFSWPPLEAVRRIRPGLILRRDMPDARPSWAERRETWRRTGLGGAAIIAGLALLAATLAGGSLREAARIGAWFTGGLLASLALLVAFGKLLLVALKAMLRAMGSKMRPAVRHGIANLYRPGSQAPFVLAALGVGVMFTLTIFLVQRSMLDQVFASAPPGMPNVFFVNITARERAGLLDLLGKQPGVETKPEITAAVPARLLSVDRVPIEDIVRQSKDRRYLRTRSVTWSAEKPSHIAVTNGAWWKPEKQPEPLVAVSQEVTGPLKLKPGARIDFLASGRTISARVAAVFRTEAIRPGSNIEFIFSPGALDGLPTVYFGGMRVRARDVPALQRAVYQRYPTVTVVNVADVLAIVQEVVNRIALVVRFVSFFTIFAGAVILASSVAGTRLRRIREVAILKALGATRLRVAGIFSIEFLVLGALAGLMGSLLASGFSALLLTRLFSATARFDVLPNLVATISAALLATGAGWLAGYRLLKAKPLAVLRQE